MKKGGGAMGTFLSILWGLLTAWTVVSTFIDLSLIGIFRILAVLVIIGLCVWKNSIPDAREWTILVLAAAVILILWLLVPNFPLSVWLKNPTVREFTFYVAIILSLTMRA